MLHAIMTRPDDSLQKSLGQSLVQQATQDLSSTHHPSPEETLQCYQKLLNRLWQVCLPILGRITIKVILERALVMTQAKYPFIRDLAGEDDGISVERLHQHASREQLDLLCEGLYEFSTHLVDLLSLLTGERLLRRLIQEISAQN
ncbi:hypothetical protein H6G20_16955 [Desertifilum sp. FACHB-1129]|uniref:Uncharacterized protein n=2 Tax=Desertifilum tharense IPPAS B-1220 TaxID=1781255 RepID=A0A1E5QML3_9CYAN|nr:MULTISPECIES: hypothetical protein [Desertifilum]MDA0212747.1 hypothetical protein [Cyanobacteria bacterium FC1]MDI9636457.1 hypothetical protein [Geitlerinema splendidum]MBD2313359.1 hypothetical protein [Desertifilum sp. FACHB-1129]MBD2334444.1 hypothetical protein [Desertifilum sp. FACHB-868]OEJ75880.1 hypothetical protein BH720_07170 [Desertifilum tharense IPPAS B-1220]